MIKKGNKKEYAWNDEERLSLMEQMGQGAGIQRYKGLGEMNAEQLWETTMNPEHRILRQITIEDLALADNTFSMLIDRKSTRLNSSHVKISYAVFCLKKKNK